MYEPRLILISLLIKLGIAAAVSSALARSRVFKRLLFAEDRTAGETIGLLAFICIPLTLGVWARVTVQNFLAADNGFETTVILGVLLGPWWAAVGAAFLAIPAMLHGEFLTLPFNLCVAMIAGLYGRLVDPEDVWSFSPFIDLSIYRWVRRNLIRPRLDRQILLLMLIVGMQMARMELAKLYPHSIFVLDTHSWIVRLAIYACPAVVVGIPLKIWNAIQIEQKLEEQKRLVLEARLDALRRQINPHFLFNTLNSIGSLVRFHPEMAREMIVRLANILRALLREHDSFVPFRDELAFTNDYLGIEVVRFGADKLRVEREIEPETLEVMVPSMVLQPLIENSIKHGLEPRLEGGTVTLRSRVREGRLVVDVEDDGVGIMPARAAAVGAVSAQSQSGNGIGMKNVRERLEVLYGGEARFEVESRPGRGTRITLELPMVYYATEETASSIA